MVKSRTILIILVLILLFTPSANAENITNAAFTVSWQPTLNFGSLIYLDIYDSAGIVTQYAYIELPAAITGTLHFTQYDEINQQPQIYETTAFDENTLTWNNQPAVGSAIDYNWSSDTVVNLTNPSKYIVLIVTGVDVVAWYHSDDSAYPPYFIPSPIPPALSIINNSKTNDTSISKIFLNNSEPITFFVLTNNENMTWNWYKDGILQSNNYDNYTTSWSTGRYHYVSVNGTNANGSSNLLAWGINVYPAMVTTTIAALNETPYNELHEAMRNKDMPALVMATTLPFTNLIGAFFYAIVWFMVFVMLWIKQKSMNIPMVIGIIFGGLMISFLPAQYQLVSVALITLGIFAILYVFFKGRG